MRQEVQIEALKEAYEALNAKTARFAERETEFRKLQESNHRIEKRLTELDMHEAKLEEHLEQLKGEERRADALQREVAKVNEKSSLNL